MAGRALLVKMLITVEPNDIFGSNFVYMICILTLSRHWYETKSDEASPSTILSSQALLVKILITLEPRCAYGSNRTLIVSCTKDYT